MIKYLDDIAKHPLKFRDNYLPWQKLGLQQTASGYGLKLTTTKQVRFNNRWYRIYATCISNVSSCFICSKGQKLYIR